MHDDSVIKQIVATQIGYDRPVLVTQRVSQQYFRNTLIHNYHDRCCVTGIVIDSLLNRQPHQALERLVSIRKSGRIERPIAKCFFMIGHSTKG
ncbi:hypothetical protein [Bifidobacterium catenulatum]|uniref:hypothetical protein n=1 Tax=Bifidobacterium catenulatum TaxID=1686 RepID=UPI0021B1787B|nr:hypothetical protein [Bifidobacterium catenulatum]